MNYELGSREWGVGRINKAALTLKLTKAEECTKEVDRILEELYSDIKHTPLLRSAITPEIKVRSRAKSD